MYVQKTNVGIIVVQFLPPLSPFISPSLDKGCSPTVQPFPQLKGESIEFLGCFRTEGHIAISNYRFFVSKDNGFHNVRIPLNTGNILNEVE